MNPDQENFQKITDSLNNKFICHKTESSNEISLLKNLINEKSNKLENIDNKIENLIFTTKEINKRIIAEELKDIDKVNSQQRIEKYIKKIDDQHNHIDSLKENVSKLELTCQSISKNYQILQTQIFKNENTLHVYQQSYLDNEVKLKESQQNSTEKCNKTNKNLIDLQTFCEKSDKESRKRNNEIEQMVKDLTQSTLSKFDLFESELAKRGTESIKITLDKWIENPKKSSQNINSENQQEKSFNNTNDPSNEKEPQNVKEKPKRTTKHNCIEKGCEPCIGHSNKILTLETNLLKMEKGLDELIENIHKINSNPSSSECKQVTSNKIPESLLSSNIKASIGENQPVNNSPKEIILKGISRTKFTPTCYANTALQLLFTLEPFTEALKKFDFKTNKDKNTLFYTIHQIYKSLSQEGSNECNAIELIKKVQQKGKINDNRFLEYQQDSLEFLEMILDILEKEFKLQFGKPWIGKSWEIKLHNKEYPQNCKHNWDEVTVETFLKLRLNMKWSFKNLTDLINKNFEQTILDSCRKCKNKKKNQSISIKKTLSDLPQYVFINLERNTYNNTTGKFQKLNERIEVKPELDLKPWMNNIQRDKCPYEIKAGIIHQGNSWNGHYRTLRNYKEAGWILYDDRQATKIKEEQAFDLLSKYAACLLYEKLNPKTMPSNQSKQIEKANVRTDDLKKCLSLSKIESNNGSEKDKKNEITYEIRRHGPNFKCLEYRFYFPKQYTGKCEKYVNYSSKHKEFTIYQRKNPDQTM